MENGCRNIVCINCLWKLIVSLSHLYCGRVCFISRDTSAKAKFNLNHFLFLGDACSVEILAKNYTWISEGNTNE